MSKKPFGIFLQVLYLLKVVFLFVCLFLVVSQFLICCCSVTPREFVYFYSETFLYPHPFFTWGSSPISSSGYPIANSDLFLLHKNILSLQLL